MNIEIEDYYKIFSGVKNCEIKEGLTFITGCNGSGKTTFIRQVVRNFKEKGLTHQYLDCNDTFHIKDLDSVGRRFKTRTAAMSGFCSEHEFYENMFFDWISGARYGDEYVGKEVGIFIDGLDSGGDVLFFKNHMSFFDTCVKDCLGRGIHFYMLVSCNNFYYLSYPSHKDAQTLFLPTFEVKKHPTYDKTAYDEYIEDIRKTGRARGYKV